MVAAKWDWNIGFHDQPLWLACRTGGGDQRGGGGDAVFNELRVLRSTSDGASEGRVPFSVCATHVLLLAGVVVFAHHPALFMGILLLFLGIASAYPQHQDRLILREALMVGFFLAGTGGARWHAAMVAAAAAAQDVPGSGVLRCHGADGHHR